MNVGHVHVVDEELPRRHRVEAGEEADERALARARGAHDGQRTPGGHGQGEVLQHRRAGFVGKAQVFKAQGTGEAGGQGRGLFRFLLQGRPVQGLENALPARHGPEKQVVLLSEGRQGLEEQIDIAGEEHHGAEGEAVRFRSEGSGAEEEGKGQGQVRKAVRERPVEGFQGQGPRFIPTVFPVRGLVAGEVFPLPAVELHHG